MRVGHAIKDRAGRRVATRRASNLKKILNAKRTLAEGLAVDVRSLKARPHFVEHHLAHLASSYYVSPFDRADVLIPQSLEMDERSLTLAEHEVLQR